MRTYSIYDETKKRHSILLMKRLSLLSIISIIFTFIVYFYTHDKLIGFGMVIYPITFLLLIIVSDIILRMLLPEYNARRKKEFELAEEMDWLKEKMRGIILLFKTREKGQQFKKAHDFVGNEIKKFEYNLAFAMLHERREVWVTALCKDNTVIRVLATLGSTHSCRPSGDLRKLREYAVNLRCDEIRHYHNHDDYKNRSEPSPQDISFNITYGDYLNDIKDQFRTFVVFWNEIYEYRILEYYDSGKSEIYFYFDVSKGI